MILGKKHPQIKLESGATTPSFGYSAGVFSKSILPRDPLPRTMPAKACLALALLACTACVGPPAAPTLVEKSEVYYTVTGEIALARGEPRTAALQYASAAQSATDLTLIAHASEVTSECLQPSLTAEIATRWLSLDPTSLDAHRAAAHAALALARIDESARQFRIILSSSPRGTDAELRDLETELDASGDIFAARSVLDRLAADFPSSAAALRLSGLAALRADDPAAAASDFSRALALTPTAGSETPAGDDAANTADARRELQQGLWRARILSGDTQEPLAESSALAQRDATPANVLNYALLLLAAGQDQAAIAQLETLTRDAESQAVALRLLGLVEFQNGDLDAAGRYFTELLATGKFIDDSFYYLGLIAERHADPEKALRLYAQVQSGDNAAAALLRASTILQTHGAPAAAKRSSTI